jgi:arginyl-tRNA synthetase
LPPSRYALDRLQAQVAEVVDADVELERPSDPEHGDFATNAALRSAKAVRRPPRELAAELAERLAELPAVAAAEVAGPGFVNLRLADSFFVAALAEIDDAYGAGFADPHERLQVEMVSANPTGPIVVSAARNGAYGDSVARLL